jgi:ABC-type nitrate/sulfonate/bicarbonate transport system substrate-binding protein
MSKTITRVCRSLLALAVLAAIPAAGAAPLSQPEVTIAQNSTLTPQVVSYYAAVKLHAFAQQGLKVKLASFRAWSEIGQAMMADENTFGFAASTVIRAVVGQHAPLRIIAMVSTRYPYNFFTRANAGIHTIADLRGHRILTVRPGETLDNVWVQVLGKAGLTMADVTRVQGFEAIGALVSKSVDAANVSDLYFDKAKEGGLVKLIDYNLWRKENGLDTRGANNLGWGATEALINKHPDTVEAFLRGLVIGTEKLRHDHDFSIALLTGEPFEMSREGAEALWKVNRDQWVVRLDPAKGDLEFDIAMVSRALNVPVEKISVERLIASKPVDHVLAEMKLSY